MRLETGSIEALISYYLQRYNSDLQRTISKERWKRDVKINSEQQWSTNFRCTLGCLSPIMGPHMYLLSLYYNVVKQNLFSPQLDINHVLNGTTPKIQHRKWGPKRDKRKGPEMCSWGSYCHLQSKYDRLNQPPSPVYIPGPGQNQPSRSGNILEGPGQNQPPKPMPMKGPGQNQPSRSKNTTFPGKWWHIVCQLFAHCFKWI